jgi:iron complex transport system ATP-binding protein
VIALKDLTVGYHGEALLSQVNLEFPQGQVTVLLGPNGCGKSTLLRTVLGLLPPLGGEILYDGEPISSLSGGAVARKAAYMAQNHTVPSIVAQRMVLHGRFPYLSFPRKYRKEDHEAVRRALETAGGLDLSNRPMQELSGGQRQKVYLAMALAQETGTILMDEPTTWLDIRHQLEVMATARALAESGRAVGLVSHDLCLALRTADRVAVLAQGALQLAAPPEEAFASGVLDLAFGVQVRRVETPTGWQYYCE